MRIERVELRRSRLPLVRFFETSFGRVSERACPLVRVEETCASGYGECVAAANEVHMELRV